jgi:hypothetical protein
VRTSDFKGSRLIHWQTSQKGFCWSRTSTG